MTTTAQATDEHERNRKHAQRGAFYGFYVDMFDIYLPIIALAPAIGYFISPDLDASTTAVITGMIFAATLVGRPLGALIFGRYADMHGRKNATVIAVAGFGILTIVVGLLPGYQTWGIGSVVAFVLLRFVIGIFVGGEYTAASPLAMEYSPKEKRGLNGGLIMTGFPLAYVSVAVITFVMLQIAPAGDIDSPYVQWGWRIPFFIGGAMALAFVAYYLKSVRESELFEGSGGGGTPVKDLFTGENRKSFIQVFVLMTGFWLSLNCVTAILPGLLRTESNLTPTQTSVTLIVAYLVVAVMYVVCAVVSQRTGRRPFLMVWGGIAGIGGTALYALYLATKPQNLFVVIIMVTLIAVLVVSVWGLTTVYINERFRTGVRATGFGLGYSLAVVIPSFYAFYQSGLSSFMPFEWTVLPLLVIGCAFITVGAAMGPETKDVDFAAADKEPALEH
ncbi:MFS transporter [Blastococcus saxobsidens]|uniref:Putative MFS family arabinose efflux permease n=1 Tax=Blastococcus saxobsidens TaxID=138336 RepID=A0A4Q7Y7Z5_9ACTN|nr:MFS transporter [Blastococcus saxobsidens]RZU32383.1 putative MFS family arabinose efflux permease [Blastococcus saxobsidens]